MNHPTISNHIDGLAGLRGFAALWIMFFHTWTVISPLTGVPWIMGISAALTGPTGVDTFFVLSGFLLFLPFAEKLINPQKVVPLRSYFKRRFFRILPAYYVQLAILASLSFWGLYQEGTMASWVAHIFMVHNFSSAWAGMINGVWWTLPIEFEFYLVLPLIYLLIKRIGIATFLTGALIVALCYKIAVFPFIAEMDRGYKSWLLGQLVGCIDLFGYGIVTAYIYKKYHHHYHALPYRHYLEWALILLGIAGMYGMLHWIRAVGREVYWSGDFSLFVWNTLNGLAISMLILGLTFNGTLGRLFSNRIMVFFGNISYGVYLWHTPFMHAIFRNSSIVESISGPENLGNLVVVSLVFIFLTFVTAMLSYRYIELPCIAIGARTWRPARDALPA